MLKLLLCASALLGLCHGHGMLLKPVSRAVRVATGLTNGMDHIGQCSNQTCKWYTQRATVPVTTNCDESMRTMGTNCDHTNPGDWPCTPGQEVPWCAPGMAEVKSPCGVFSGGWMFNGRDMLDLDGSPQEKWVAGEAASVVWNIIANHGGGYSYRLCPQDGDLTEECFQSHTLKFHNDTQLIVDQDLNVLQTTTARRTTNGTTPAGSTWTRNPVPMENAAGYVPIPNMPDAYGRGPFKFAVMDFVQVPSDIAPGNYILSFRWDSEQVQQVWSQCSDITIVNPGYKAKRNPSLAIKMPAASRPTHSNLCLGSSLPLDTSDCDIWGQVYDNLGGSKWGDAGFRADPCGWKSKTKEKWSIEVICESFRNKLYITELYLLGPEVSGPFPHYITGLSKLGALSLVSSNISGPLPENFGDLTTLDMLWLDHNPKLVGPLPDSFADLRLDVLEMHYSGIGNTTLPTMNYRDITDCTLNGLVFKCPLPEGAETCGASCV